MKSSDISGFEPSPVPEYVPEIVLAEGPLGVSVKEVLPNPTNVDLTQYAVVDPETMAEFRRAVEDDVLKVLVDKKIDVLNGGFVRLVDHMGSDLSIVRSARVSYDADWREGDEKKDEKLIAYLMKNRHTSPFESVQFTFEVKAPIFVFRQWHRHRTWAYNEISARYTELDEGYYVPELKDITAQHSSNKQMRTTEQHPDAAWMQREISEQNEAAFTTYRTLIARGCPRELARSVLPVGAYSRMFASVNLHNLFHFLRLRLHEHSQYEIRVYAEAMLQLIEPIVPVAVREFKNTL
jgi:thymidylate synthase (FAD)